MTEAHTMGSTPGKEGPPRILIVEDDGIIGMNIEQTLASLGYDVHGVATSSEEALAYATQRCPDLVLLDIRIKGKLDGIQTAAILRERLGVPVVYLTAHADTATIERAKKTEPLGYLVKPVKQAELRSAVEIALYRDGMDRRLRQRERWFSTTLRSIADAVVAVDLSGRITFMNPAAEGLMGLSYDEARGKLASEVIRLKAVAGAPGELNPLEQALRERRRVEINEARLGGDDGETIRIISDSAAPVEVDGELLGAVMVFRDVTEQQRLRQQVELNDRLASLGTMAAGVAHEVNNPLSVVVGNADVVLELLDQMAAARATANGEARAPTALDDARLAMEDLRSAADRITRIVRDLQTFARPTPVSSENADVAQAVAWAIRSTSYEFHHRARVVTELSSLPRVAMDETKLGQVLVNLLINAAHAIAPGNVAGNQVSVRARAEGATVIIEVQDTGSGIPREALAHVFEPFYTKPVGGGSGLGLSICHGIVSAYGGSIQIETNEGNGTRFQMMLPVARTPPLPAKVEPVACPEHVGRLLVIDDEEPLLQVIGRVLKAHAVVCTTSAREALARLARGETYDIILCDVMMPDMTGVAFFEELLRSRPDDARRVIFMTGGALTATIEDFLASVPNRCLSKPFDVLGLRGIVQEILATTTASRERE